MTIHFEESWPGATLHCPFLAWMPNHHFFCFFPFASSGVLSLVFGSDLAAIRHVYFGSTMQSLHRACFLPAGLIFFFCNQVMPNWLTPNLSRAKWWGRML